MKHIITAALLFLATQSAYTEEIRYVSDELRVPLRSSPCNSCKIIHSGLKSGTRLTVLESNEEGWSRVQTRRGTEGWMPDQYLVNQQIARVRIVQVAEQAEKLKTEATALQGQMTEKENQLTEMQQRIAQLESDNSALSQELTDIKQVSANAITLHNQNMDFSKRNKLLQDEVDRLTALNDQLKGDQIYTWFLYGALAVFIGAMLTVLIPRLKTKRKYSEWG